MSDLLASARGHVRVGAQHAVFRRT